MANPVENLVAVGIGLVAGQSALRGQQSVMAHQIGSNPAAYPTLSSLMPGLGSSTPAFPLIAPRENSEFRGIISNNLRIKQQIERSQSAAMNTSSVIQRLMKRDQELQARIAAGTMRVEDAMSLGADLESARGAALGILRGVDKRFSNIINDPDNASLVTQLTGRLSDPTLTSTEIVNTLGSFGTLTQGVERGGNILSRMAVGQRKLIENSQVGAVRTFNQVRVQSGVTTMLNSVDDLNPLQQSAFTTFKDRITQITGKPPEFDASRGNLYTVNASIEGEQKALTYAQFRINGQSISLPLDDLNSHKTKFGSIYFRGAHADSIFGVTGKTIQLDASGQGTLKSGMDYLFNPNTGAIYDMIKQVSEGNGTFDDLLFSTNDSKEEGVSKMMEYLNPSYNTTGAIARKEAQVQFINPNAQVGVEELDMFEQRREIARGLGLDLRAHAGPSVTSKSKYFYTELPKIDENGNVISPARMPHFLEGFPLGSIDPNTGETLSAVSVTRRPPRSVTSTYPVGKRPSNRGLMSLTGGNSPMEDVFKQLHAFNTSGPFADMRAMGMEDWFTHFAFLTTEQGDEEFARLVPDGARRRLNPYAESEGTVMRPAPAVEIHRGRKELQGRAGSLDVPFDYNQKFDPIFEELSRLDTVDPEARQAAVARIAGGMTFEEGEFVGQRATDVGGLEQVFLNVPGTPEQGPIRLRDVTTNESKIKFHFSREIPFQATKAEGSSKTTEFEHFPAHNSGLDYDAKLKIQLEQSRIDARQRAIGAHHQKYGPNWKNSPRDQRKAMGRELSQSIETEIAAARNYILQTATTTQGVRRAEIESKSLDFVRQFAGSGFDFTSLGPVQAAMKQVTYLMSGKEMYKEGNIRLLRTQQQTAAALLLPQKPTAQMLLSGRGPNNLLDSVSQIKDKKISESFHGAMRGILNRTDTRKGTVKEAYRAADTDVLASLLVYAQKNLPDPIKLAAQGKKGGKKVATTRTLNKERASMLGLIFGQEKKNGLGELANRAIGGDADAQKALGDLGLSDDFIGDLAHGIDNANVTLGLVMHHARDSAFDQQQGMSRERRNIEELRHAIGMPTHPLHEEAKNYLDIITSRTETLDPRYQEHLIKTIEKSSVAPGKNELVLDLADLRLDQSTKEQMLGSIKESGGYIRTKHGDVFVPSATSRAELSAKDMRGERHVVDTKLAEMIDKMLQVVSSNLDMVDDESMGKIQTLGEGIKRQLYDQAMEAASSIYEGSIEGGRYRMVFVDTHPEAALHHGYVQGMNKKDINEIFDQMIKDAMGTEEKTFLSNWKEDFLNNTSPSGNAMPMMTGQHPNIGPHVDSFMRGYYNPEMDVKGGMSIPWHGEEMDGVWTRVGGVIENKASADFDGDQIGTVPARVKRSGLPANATQKEVQSYYKNWIEETIGPQALEVQALKKKEWAKARIELTQKVQSSLAALINRQADPSSPTSPRILDQELRAFMKNAGQGDIGILSNNFELLRKVSRRLQETGAVNDSEYIRMSVLAQVLDQEAVNFKHNDRSVRTILESMVDGVMEQENSKEAATKLFALLSDLGLDIADRTGAQIDMAASVMAEYASTKSATVATRPAEKVPPSALVGNVMSGARNSATDALEIQGNLGNATVAAAIEAMPGPAGASARQEIAGAMRAAGIKSDHPNLVAAGNAAVKEAAAQKLRDNLVSKRRQISDAGQALMSNKFARVTGIAGMAMAGAYAIFNKGYDDEPLADVPPPPPGRNMGSYSADMQTANNPNFLNDSYNRQGLDIADANHNADYYESNIPSPNTLQKRGYIDGSSARISSRGIVLDRTNPLDYVNAIRSGLPNSSISLTINTNNQVPSDLERRL
jgi:hypothetical protein